MSITRSAPAGALRRLAVAAALDLPAVVVLAALVAEPSTRELALVNLAVQVGVIVLGGCLPAYRRDLMSCVDGAWPWGLAWLGALTLLYGDTSSPVVVLVAGIYLAIGLRGGLWAVAVVVAQGIPSEDMPRYHYRRLVWRREGYRSETLPMQHEILQQGVLTASVLAMPAMLVVAAPHGVGPLAIGGALLWGVCFALESLADLQKARFTRRGSGEARTCDVGLWRFSRHPNYFFQWLQWHGAILVALPSLIALGGEIALLVWLVFAAALFGISALMYYVLVHYTGAIPAEHFSVQRRPGYVDYQARVNRFCPGPPR